MNYLIKLKVQRMADHHKALGSIYTQQELIFDSYALATEFNVPQREVRRVLSDLRKDMTVITFSRRINGKKGLYVLYEESNPLHQREFAKVIDSRLKEFKSLYFNNIVKYLPILREDKMINQLNMITLALQGETE